MGRRRQLIRQTARVRVVRNRSCRVSFGGGGEIDGHGGMSRVMDGRQASDG